MVKCETQKSKVINILGRKEYFSLGVRHDRPLGPACSEAHASTTKTLGELKMQTGIIQQRLISHQPAVLFSQKNQPLAISQQYFSLRKN
jgi:hypothetical protein